MIRINIVGSVRSNNPIVLVLNTIVWIACTPGAFVFGNLGSWFSKHAVRAYKRIH